MHACIGMLLTLFLTLALLPVLPAAAAPEVMVEVIFENGLNEITKAPCSNFVASIKVTLPAGVVIDFWIMEIHWDPAVLELQTGTTADVIEGPFMKAFGPTIFVLRDPDNVNGILPDIACGFFTAVKASGSGILCYIKFHCKAPGDGNIIIFDPCPPGEETILLDVLNVVPIDVVINGVVHQQTEPEPPNAEFTPADCTFVYVCTDVILEGSASTDGFDTLPYPGHVCPITEWKWEIDESCDGTIDLTLYGKVVVYHCEAPGDVGIKLTVWAPDPSPPTHPHYVEYDSETHIIHQIGWEIPVYVDIKPGSFPNPINIKSQGLVPVAICGTADFDVTTIDPQTIRLTREGVEDGVAPIRWSYEDVATPYTGEPCGGHELGGDGYLDLTLKFKTQELVATLGLNAFKGEVIVLILTGNLKEEDGGTPIRGQDCVWILKYVRIQKLIAHMLRYEAYMQSFYS